MLETPQTITQTGGSKKLKGGKKSLKWRRKKRASLIKRTTALWKKLENGAGVGCKIPKGPWGTG